MAPNHIQGPKYLSATSASLFRQCPKRWKFRYIDKLPDPPGQEALAGSFAHSVLEALLQRAPEERTREVVREIATAQWPAMRDSSEFTELALDPDAVRTFKWHSWGAISGLWNLEDPRKVDVRQTELRVEVELGGVPFLGFIDRLEVEDDGLVVSDYKSGRPPPQRFEQRSLEQVLLYAAAVSQSHFGVPARVRLLYLGSKIISEEVTEERLEGVTQRLRDTWDAIASSRQRSDFPAKVGKLCGWCIYAEHCPEGESYLRRSQGEQGEYFPSGAADS